MEFHRRFSLLRQSLPDASIPESVAQLRLRLIREEVDELAAAVRKADIVEIADALADIVYVAYGSAVCYGIDLDLVLEEVHRSNMSKLDSAGLPVRRADGKVLKSELYSPPDVRRALRNQRPLS